MPASITLWDRTTPVNNGTADSGINWAEGQDPSTVNNSARAMMERLAEYYYDMGAVNTVGGTANAMTVTLNDSATAYASGQHFSAIPPTANTTTTPTLNVNTIGAKTIKKYDSSGALVALAVGDNAPGVRRYLYLSGPDAIILLNPALDSAAPLFGRPLPTLANNASDATNDIDFSAGAANDLSTSATGLMWVACAALTKRLDANWAAGTNQGMRYSGAAIANTTYNLWACWTDAGVQDYYADPSAVQATVLGHLQAETGGSSYTHLCLLGSIIRSGGAIVGFQQHGNYFYLNVPVNSIDATNPGTSAVTAALALPTGRQLTALISAQIVTGTTSTTFVALVTPLSTTDTAPSTTVNTFRLQTLPTAGSYAGGTWLQCLTDTSSQVRYRLGASDAATTFRMITHGWIDLRGRA